MNEINESNETYEPPFLMEVGEFSAETQGFHACWIESILVGFADC